MSKENNEKSALVPRLRFPEFREAGAWEEHELSAIANVVMGSSPSSDSYNTESIGLPFMQGNADIKDGFSAPRLFTSQITKECEVGDVLLSVRAPVGTVARSLHLACIGRGLAAIRTRPPNVLEYLYQWLLAFEPQWHKISQGGTFDAVNSDVVRGLYVDLPPELAEQQKIADCLSSLDELITAEAQKLDALKTHKKGLMQQLFPREGETAPRLRFPEFREAGAWSTGPAGKLFSNRIERGRSGLPIYSVTMTDGLVPRASLDRKIDDLAESGANKTVHSGDLAYNMMRMWQGAVGIAPEDCMVSPAYIVLEPRGVNPFFFYFLLKQPQMLRVLTAHSRGLTEDRLRLYYDDFAKIALPCPSLAEQDRISDCLSSIDKLIATQDQHIEQLKIHKKGLMRQLFPVLEEVPV